MTETEACGGRLISPGSYKNFFFSVGVETNQFSVSARKVTNKLSTVVLVILHKVPLFQFCDTIFAPAPVILCLVSKLRSTETYALVLFYCHMK